MIIKKYVGKTESEATDEAKKELGQNIVVMNVRPLKKSGLLALFQAQKIEVTVALEEETERPATRTLTPDKSTIPAARKPLVEGSQRDTVKPVIKVNKSPDIIDEGSAIEEKLDNLSNLLEKNIKFNEKDDEKEKEKSLDEPEKETHKRSSSDDSSISDENLSFIKLLYNTLIENEVDEIYVNQLTDEVEKISKPGMSFDFALANVYQKMVLKFGKSEPIEPIEAGAGPRAEIFIGPTGVGKTTTIAKLASELSVTQKKKVALLTVDTYRIAAAEQLRTYASILEIPFRVIYSVEEMKQAVEDFKDFDYIMVDTAGHSQHNDELKSDIEAFIRTLEDNVECENFLVLSATTKYRDLIEIADSYSEVVAYKLIFTKMDETGAKGNLYNVRMHTGAPIAYITNGQNVPDDIAIFDAQRIVKNLLGGKS